MGIATTTLSTIIGAVVGTILLSVFIYLLVIVTRKESRKTTIRNSIDQMTKVRLATQAVQQFEVGVQRSTVL